MVTIETIYSILAQHGRTKPSRVPRLLLPCKSRRQSNRNRVA